MELCIWLELCTTVVVGVGLVGTGGALVGGVVEHGSGAGRRVLGNGLVLAES